MSGAGLTTRKDTEAEKERLSVLTQDMFDKVGAYLRGELETTCEEYRLLENLNKLTAQRYSELTVQANGMNENLAQLFEKYSNLEKYILQIDQIEAGVSQLENTTKELDQYSKQLEERFNQLQYHG